MTSVDCFKILGIWLYTEHLMEGSNDEIKTNSQLNTIASYIGCEKKDKGGSNLDVFIPIYLS